MKHIYKQLEKIAKQHEGVTIFQTHELFGKACRRVYNHYIKKKGIVMNHYISDKILDNEAVELTQRFFRRYYTSSNEKENKQ